MTDDESDIFVDLEPSIPRVTATGLSDPELLRAFPTIPWGHALPIAVKIDGILKGGLGCRLCIARRGLHGREVPGLPQNADEWKAHMREHHAEVLK